MDFSETITSKAFNTLHTRKFNAPRISPLSADITALYKHLENKLNALMAELKEDATNANIWYKFAKACMAYLVIFNRRRPAVSTLVSLRRQRSVHKDNPFVFAIPGNSSSNIRPHDALREEAKECGAEDPSTLTSTRLRKHVATSCQLLHLAEDDVDILASFMGHDTRTHREFYRNPDEALQLARASEFFTLLDRGELTMDQGKYLTDITVSPDEVVEEDGRSEGGVEEGDDRGKTAALNLWAARESAR
ncbi:Putative auxin response factor 20 [Frankliniella fusca]|uniref:Auxin response factor 20 n=1 Tax=Frankliniella fusca TaxID=407009 RepID=A0AAE1HDA0_9NEOP|nr:Putative auxin response factor 20 [Frankliniella fusca]